MARRLIQKGWEDFRRNVVPMDAPSAQVTLMRRGFYAGAIYLFTELASTLDPGQEPTDADIVQIKAVQEEIDRYGEELAVDALMQARKKTAP